MADVNTFVEKTLELLNLEREAEITEATAFYDSADNSALEKKGVCLSKLIVFSRRTGLYGRTLLTLGKGKTSRHLAESSLPAHRITPGSSMKKCFYDCASHDFNSNGIYNASYTL